MGKIFLLGLGAQKSGTTWLYKYLQSRRECANGILKEHGVWISNLQTRKPSAQFNVKVALLNKAFDELRKAREDKVPVTDKLEMRVLGLMDNLSAEFESSYYLKYYERLVRRNPKTRMVCDITPEYTKLTRDQLVTVRDFIEGAGFDLRIVYLMRDPIERLYSALRMHDRNRVLAGENVTWTADKRVVGDAARKGHRVHSEYDRTLENIDAVFAPDKVFTGFYEDLFTEETLRRFCSFVDLPYQPGAFDVRVNESPRNEELTAAQIAEIRQEYDEIYSYCANRFGEEKIAALWPHYNVK